MINQEQRPVTVTVNIETKGCRGPAIAAIIALVVFLLVLTYWSVGGLLVPSQVIQAQPSPPVSEGGNGQGQAQESRVREALRKEGYEQPLGDSDTAIRQNLGLKANEGKIADFVGRNPVTNRWLAAESKGGNFATAIDQLKNTARLLWQRNPSATSANTEFRIYTNAEQYAKLQLPPEASRLGGYAMRDGYLGYTDSALGWVYETIDGVRVLVMLAP